MSAARADQGFDELTRLATNLGEDQVPFIARYDT
jgi:hypothetical protein